MAAAEDLPFVLQRVIVDALKAAGIEFEVQTDFDNYINDINKASEFWSLVIDRDAQLKALAPTTDVLIDKLHDCDTSVIRHIKNALRKQNRVVPLHSDSLEDWIFEVQDKLAAQGVYDGLLILWDESNLMKMMSITNISVVLLSDHTRNFIRNSQQYPPRIVQRRLNKTCIICFLFILVLRIWQHIMLVRLVLHLEASLNSSVLIQRFVSFSKMRKLMLMVE